MENRIIKNFEGLSLYEKVNLLEFLNDNMATKMTYENMTKKYMNIDFNLGENVFVLFSENDILGFCVCINREEKMRKEVFVIDFVLGRNDDLRTVQELYAKIESTLEFKDSKIKIGTKRYEKYNDVFLKAGLFNTYDAILMAVEKNEFVFSEDRNKIFLEEITFENSEIFARIHNDAFLNSPNGASIEAGRVYEISRTYEKHENGMSGMGVYDDENVAIYDVEFIDEKKAVIETVAVKNDFQSKGCGKYLIERLAKILFEEGFETIELLVMSSNERAVNLYKKLGFKKIETYSKWYEKLN